MRHSLFIFFLILSFQTFTQHAINGKILNESGVPVPFASVYIKNSNYGVSTDLNGGFSLSLKEGEQHIVVQAVGYQKKQLKILVPFTEENSLEIKLFSEALKLDEITINAKRKDPAYAIIQKAINHKDSNSAYLGLPFSANAYHKVTINEIKKKPDSLGKTTFQKQLIEAQSNLYYNKKNIKEQVIAYKNLNNKKQEIANIEVGTNHLYSNQFAINYKEQDPSIFRNHVSTEHINLYSSYVRINQLGPFTFLSPLANNSKLSYIFRLDEVVYLEGTPVNKIEVNPRFPGANLFRGIIYIEEKNWSILKVDFDIDSKSIYFFDSFHLSINYGIKNGYSIPLKEAFNYGMKDGRNHLMGKSITVFNDYNFNSTPPKKLFGNNQMLGYEKDALEKDTIFWNITRKDTLVDNEKLFIKVQDSIVAYHSSPEYFKEQDSIYNKLKFWDIPLNGVGIKNTFKKTHCYINPLVSSYNLWGIGGSRFMTGGYASKYFNNNSGVTFGPWIDYGPRNRDLKGFGYLSYMFDPMKFRTIIIKGGDVYDWINPYESIEVTLSGSNWLRKKTYGFEYNQELFNGFYAGTELVVSERTSIDGLDLPTWQDNLFGETNTPRVFDPWNETLIHIYTKIIPGQKYYLEPNRKVIIENKYPIIEVKLTKGIPKILKSEVNFSYVDLKVNDQIDFPIFGTFKYRLHAGTFLNGDSISTKFTNYQFFRGSDDFYYSNPLRSFQLLGPSISTRMAFTQITAIHNFGGLFLNKIPFIHKLGFNEVVGGGFLYLNQNNFSHSELYAGLEWPFKIKDQLFKIGGYYVIENTTTKFRSAFKIGIDFFNLSTKSWSY